MQNYWQLLPGVALFAAPGVGGVAPEQRIGGLVETNFFKGLLGSMSIFTIIKKYPGALCTGRLVQNATERTHCHTCLKQAYS